MTHEYASKIVNALQHSLTHVDIGRIDGREVTGDEIVEALDMALDALERRDRE